jgi:hypothetical protein
MDGCTSAPFVLCEKNKSSLTVATLVARNVTAAMLVPVVECGEIYV